MYKDRRYPMNHAADAKTADPADKEPRKTDFSPIDGLDEESRNMLEMIRALFPENDREPGPDEGHAAPQADPCADHAEQEPDQELIQRLSEEFDELAKGILYGGPDLKEKNGEFCERPLYAAPDVDADRDAPDPSDEDGHTPGDDDDVITYF